jgi:hypothetical protein
MEIRCAVCNEAKPEWVNGCACLRPGQLRLRRLIFAHRYLISQLQAIESIIRGEATTWEPPRMEGEI